MIKHLVAMKELIHESRAVRRSTGGLFIAERNLRKERNRVGNCDVIIVGTMWVTP
jgi:hypothetical protein